jgi:hypothetical protein
MDEAGSRDTPHLVAPDPRVDLGQATPGASRRMADQAIQQADEAGPRRGRGVKLQPEVTAPGAASSGAACRGSGGAGCRGGKF